LNTEIVNYSAIVPAPRNAASLRSAYSETLVLQFKEADSILKNQVDKIAAQFKTLLPEFYAAYKNNRIILDAGSSSTKATGTVIASPGASPVAGALVAVVGQPWNATTDAQGKYNLLIPVPGTYTLTCTAPSFGEAVQTNIEITLGQATTVNFTLGPA